MKIRELFERDIFRSINGVVKADQLDESSVWQELDEFVITQELSRHINDLVAVLLSTIDSEANAADKNGVWVSGFFGSGKSHFIKVLSYLMDNSEHHHGGQARRAVDFFEDKLSDPLLFADLKRLVNAAADTILFNIDSKADHRQGRDTLLRVFLRVLNEKQGFSGDHPHIAHMERHLQEKGKLETFHEAFRREAKAEWLDERDAYEYYRDQVVAAWMKVTGQSEDSAQTWVDAAEERLSITPENFAKWVLRYLDREGSERRIMFLVDEVGAFIGSDTHLMLNLQTITEQLGTVCNGRAWVVVTSQEDLDAVLGELTNAKQHDFSKIQGRFKTRLSLSSANVDEVIKRRLLKKSDAALPALHRAYKGKHDILKNQLSFTHAGMSFKTYVDEDDFAEAYPFAAYQFNLVQKVFESIRKAGATGLHLSQGERSTLDAFQSAAKQLGDEQIGALVPFWRFYSAVEGFLDSSVKRTIDQARENHVLDEFDVTILTVLFLIRYIDELPGSVDNLVTLCVDEIDADRLALRRNIEESLARLEGETLIARNGDLYFFLTNEERDIGNEIKQTPVPAGGEERALGAIIFEDILGDVRKHSYTLTKKEFQFTRTCDGHVHGSRTEGDLEVAFVSPVGDEYAHYDQKRCIMETAGDVGRVLVRLPDAADLGRELRTYLQTEQYVKTKHTGSLPDTTKRILRDRSEDNRSRRARIVNTLGTMIQDAGYFACGQELDLDHSEPKAALAKAMEYLIQNAYPKMTFLEKLLEDPRKAIQSILRANDIDQIAIAIGSEEANPRAMADLRGYLELSARKNREVVLHELIHKHYGARPYGWPELDVALLVARLAVMKEVDLVVDSALLPLDKAYEYLTSISKQRSVAIRRREAAGTDLIKGAGSLAKELFGQRGPSAEDELFSWLRDQLQAWENDLRQYESLASSGEYPGIDEIQNALALLPKFTGERESVRFLNRFKESKSELLEVHDDIQELQGFYTNQRKAWEQLRSNVQTLRQNKFQLDEHKTAGPALREMETILAMKHPYKSLHKAPQLVATATGVNEELMRARREEATSEIQRLQEALAGELNKAQADDALRRIASKRLSEMVDVAERAISIAHIAQARAEAEQAYEYGLKAIEEAENKKAESPTRKTRDLVARSLCSGTYIETHDQADEYVEKLRQELNAAVDAGERVRLK